MINVEINQEDCALVLKPNGHIDVYTPPPGDQGHESDNIRLMRIILTALVKTVSVPEDTQRLLAEIDANFDEEHTLH